MNLIKITELCAEHFAAVAFPAPYLETWVKQGLSSKEHIYVITKASQYVGKVPSKTVDEICRLITSMGYNALSKRALMTPVESDEFLHKLWRNHFPDVSYPDGKWVHFLKSWSDKPHILSKAFATVARHKGPQLWNVEHISKSLTDRAREYDKRNDKQKPDR